MGDKTKQKEKKNVALLLVGSQKVIQTLQGNGIYKSGAPEGTNNIFS